MALWEQHQRRPRSAAGLPRVGLALILAALPLLVSAAETPSRMVSLAADGHRRAVQRLHRPPRPCPAPASASSVSAGTATATTHPETVLIEDLGRAMDRRNGRFIMVGEASRL
jgi:hypothetical protein